MSRSFRISSVEKPIGLGPLEIEYSVIVHYEYDPGKPKTIKKDKIQILIRDLYMNAIAGGGKFDQPPYIHNFDARIGYFATNRLMEILSTKNPEQNQSIKLNDDYFRELLEVEPQRVNFGDWVQLEPEEILTTHHVFISCGQRTIEERELGKQISSLVKDKTGYDGYFSEYQTSLEGLTENIFNALRASAAFISIMHRRDMVNHEKGQYRGSVWVEQEISIAAFIVQSLRLTLPTRCYIEKGIIQEGVRGYIILNPIEFTSAQDIISDLELWFPSIMPKKK